MAHHKVGALMGWDNVAGFVIESHKAADPRPFTFKTHYVSAASTLQTVGVNQTGVWHSAGAATDQTVDFACPQTLTTRVLNLRLIFDKHFRIHNSPSIPLVFSFVMNALLVAFGRG